jgi:hypothetical protein
VHLLFKQDGVRADDDETSLGDQPADDFRQVLVDQRLATGDRNDGRAAFLGRMQSVGDRNPLVQDFIRIIDLAASRAFQIAAEQRFQHHHERVFLAT